MSNTDEQVGQLIEAVEGKEGKGAEPDKTEETPQYTKSQLESILKERLDREKRKSVEAQEKARQEAEQKALEEQGEFKKLNEQLKAQLADYETLKASNEDNVASLTELLQKELEGVPDYVLDLLNEKSPAQQLRYIAQNREKWTKKEDKADWNLGKLPDGTTRKTDPKQSAEADRGMANLLGFGRK